MEHLTQLYAGVKEIRMIAMCVFSNVLKFPQCDYYLDSALLSSYKATTGAWDPPVESLNASVCRFDYLCSPVCVERTRQTPSPSVDVERLSADVERTRQTPSPSQRQTPSSLVGATRLASVVVVCAGGARGIKVCRTFQTPPTSKAHADRLQ